MTPEMTGLFLETWSKYDENATGYIPIASFKNLMFDLGAPLGWEESMVSNERR